MSAEIHELVARAYRAVNSHDLDAYLETVHPDVEFRSLIAEADDREYRGHAGARQYWRTVVDAFTELRYEPDEVVVVGDRGMVRFRAMGRVEGVEVCQTMWQAFRVRDGLMARWEICRTEEEARAASGIGMPP